MLYIVLSDGSEAPIYFNIKITYTCSGPYYKKWSNPLFRRTPNLPLVLIANLRNINKLYMLFTKTFTILGLLYSFTIQTTFRPKVVCI